MTSNILDGLASNMRSASKQSSQMLVQRSVLEDTDDITT